MSNKNKEIENKHLICSLCKELIDNPRLLPCSRSACNKCIQKSIQNNAFTCDLCKKNHDLPVNGFPLSPQIAYLLKKYHKQNEKSNEKDLNNKKNNDDLVCTTKIKKRSKI